MTGIRIPLGALDYLRPLLDSFPERPDATVDVRKRACYNLYMPDSKSLGINAVGISRPDRIKLPQAEIAAFCRRHHIRKLAIFGSVLRDDFRPDSDIDVLVEFESGYAVGLIRLAGIEIELAQLLGHKVDLRTPPELSHYFRQEVLESALVQYEQG